MFCCVFFLLFILCWKIWKNARWMIAWLNAPPGRPFLFVVRTRKLCHFGQLCAQSWTVACVLPAIDSLVCEWRLDLKRRRIVGRNTIFPIFHYLCPHCCMRMWMWMRALIYQRDFKTISISKVKHLNILSYFLFWPSICKAAFCFWKSIAPTGIAIHVNYYLKYELKLPRNTCNLIITWCNHNSSLTVL